MLLQSEERQQIFFTIQGIEDAIKFVFPDLYCFLNFPLSLPVLFIGYFGKTRNPKLKFRVSKMSGIIFQGKFWLSLFKKSNFWKPEIPDLNFSSNPNAHSYPI